MYEVEINNARIIIQPRFNRDYEMYDKKEYLGDGAYINFDGYHVVLTAENGIYATDTIALEPNVLERFLNYVERLKQHLKAGKS